MSKKKKTPDEQANIPAMPDTCWMCGLQLHRRIWKKSTDLCWKCQDALSRKITRNNKRARIKGLEATLTIAQWGKILRGSQGFCAYCHEYFGYQALVIEHVQPIANGGETSASNCLPACGWCNERRWREAQKGGVA